MTPIERDNQVKVIKDVAGKIDPNLKELQKFFKNNFNQGIIKIGDHAIYDLNTIFYTSPQIKKKFKDDPIQPITITYIRLDVIFFTWDKHPEFGEEYTMYSADWSKYLYLKEIKLSEIWKNKEYLNEKDYDEWYIQTKSVEFDTKYTNIIDDIKYKIDIPKNIEEVFNFFDKELTEADKKMLLKHKAIEFHHTLGRWIRNNFELWNTQSELKAWLIDKSFTHPDDMSNYLIEEYQKHLKLL